jgi:dienelactone hydrolase
VRLTLAEAGRTLTRASTTRMLIAHAEGERSLRPRTAGFYGEMFDPARMPTRKPAVLLFGGSEGGLATKDIAALLAARGYPTLALAYFAERGLPRGLIRIRLEYFAHALRWLARQPGVDRTRLVVAGVSRGSEAAQLLGIHYPQLVHGVVALVPSNTAQCGIPRYTGQLVRCIGPAWTLRGRAIRYADFASPYATPALADERINGPIFLDCGGQDPLWPSCPMAHAIVARLREHRFRHDVTLLAYPNAGHGVGYLLPNVPFYLATGGTALADQRARTDAWPRLLAFLRSLR